MERDHDKASNPLLDLVGSPGLTLSICHFLGTTSARDLACVSTLSEETVHQIMSHLKKLLPPQICVVGGRVGMKVLDAIQAFDPATSSWKILKPMQSSRNGCGAVAYRDHLYIMGGRNDQGKVSKDV